ncbi:MAG: type V CRISPR-associated endonuclease Cas1 [Deltaproteobacteria bacterium]|nr:type V CRISPR-associated endonuclease Cas1 [Deltaproteobacteria bacterium]
MLSLPDFREKNIVICFAAEGQKVSFKNDNLIIKDEEENTVLQTTCHKIFSLWIAGNITITSGILERSKKFGFSIYMLSHNCRPYGLWSSATEGNFLLRRKQYDYKELNIARHLVNNKIINQTELLKGIRGKSQGAKDAIDKMTEYARQAETAVDLQMLLGLEGVASRLYFSHWFDDMEWKGRRPRTKIDIINTTLDIGYTYLFNITECMLNLYGFDLYQGVYHRSFYQRKSLVCDIVEPFRCVIDKQIKRAYGLKQMQKDDFREQKGQYFLKIEKNKDYTRWLIQSLLEHKEDMFSYVQEYYRCFMRRKPIEHYPVFKIKE